MGKISMFFLLFATQKSSEIASLKNVYFLGLTYEQISGEYCNLGHFGWIFLQFVWYRPNQPMNFSGEPSSRYHTADSGRLPTQHLTRKGDKHNMEWHPQASGSCKKPWANLPKQPL